MSGGKIGNLLDAVLPPDYARVKGQSARIQNFLEQNLPSPLNQAVTVLSIDDDSIVIAASTPVVANYLRLHQAEMQQQLFESLNLKQRLRFRSLPESLLHPPAAATSARQPRAVSEQSIDALERNADWIEDEELRAALKSLARSLKSD